MKRTFIIAILGLGLAILAYSGVYFVGTTTQRSINNDENPELAWLKSEFGLSDEEYARIRKLHYAYLPRCDEMCTLVSEKNELLKKLMLSGEEKAEERELVLKEAVTIRASCQEMMLNHFYLLSREIRPEPRERYLEWVMTKTVTPSHADLEETLRHHP